MGGLTAAKVVEMGDLSCWSGQSHRGVLPWGLSSGFRGGPET